MERDMMWERRSASMHLILAAAAVGAIAFLADPALAQQDDQAPALADSAGQTFDSGKPPTYSFPDSTAISQPVFSDSSAVDSESIDAAPADSAPIDDSDEPH
jgi:hypothetical protein